MEWTSVKEKYPQNVQKVRVMVYDAKTKKDIEVDAVFYDHEDCRAWELVETGEHDITAKPTHWKDNG
jgi:uncharacterized protein DUF551